jgi:predicted Zn-dependent protease
MHRQLLTALVALTLVIGTGTAPALRAGELSNLPELGDTSATVMSPAEEKVVGEKFMRDARLHLKFLDDPEINGYLRALGAGLVRHADVGQEDFHFFIIDDSTLNAFAVPGGYIGVHTGLILAARDEAELASVLAHEITHVTQRHMPRLLAQAQERSLPTMAALVAAILLGGQAGSAAVAMTTAANVQQQLNYTRSFEQEADRLGMGILAHAHYDPRAMPEFFERLQNWNRLYDSNVPEFLRTHPVTSDRIAESRARAERLSADGKTDSLAFHQVQAKIRVLSSTNEAETVKEFESRLKQGKDAYPDALRYGYALALARAGRYDQARGEIENLVKRRPDEPMYLTAQADIEMSAANFGRAVELYRAALRTHPDYEPLVPLYADALIKTGHAGQAATLLDKAVRKRRDDPALYRLLATAAGDAGDPVAAHRAMAEHYYLNGNLHEAVSQLQIASATVQNNFYVQSSIDARIQTIKDEIALYEDDKQR